MEELPFEQLIKKIREKKAPFAVVLEMTKRCNLRCLHCYLPGNAGGKTEELGIVEIKSILNDLKKAGCLKLTLTGGEPTLRDDFLEVFSYSHQKGFATTLFTNATLLTPRLKRAILKARPYGVEWSVYGASAEVHDTVTGVPGSFHLAVRNMEWLIKRGVRVVMKSVLFSSTYQEVKALDDLSKKWGIPFHPTFRIFSSLDPNRLPEKLRIRTGDLKTLVRGGRFPWFNPPGGDDAPEEEWPCNAGRQACCISAEGKVYPCVALRWECGDLRKGPFEEIWNDSPVLKEIRSYQVKNFKKCFRCRLRRRCHFCPGMGFFEHGDMLRPSQEMCRLTRAMVQEE